MSKDELSVREIDNGVVLGEPIKTNEHAVAGPKVEDLEFDNLPMFRSFGVNDSHLDFNIVHDPLVDCVVCVVDGSSFSVCFGVELVVSHAQPADGALCAPCVEECFDLDGFS